ncbi:hypothetical protein [Paenibacillus sp. sgz302251]|uniref:hypothetical protein n=1 Tax=Paenibacillus sp. sgz302251 TaxID=3414493 RepID=UPI003C7EB496
MVNKRQQQEAHGIGQIEGQLEQQIQAAVDIQGESKLDQEITSAANNHDSELDEINEK